MSRIGNSPIKLPPKVEVTLASGEISVKGPLGSLSQRFGEGISIEQNGDTLTFKAANAEVNAMHGTVRALVANMVKGVTAGYEKRLALVGVGYVLVEAIGLAPSPLEPSGDGIAEGLSIIAGDALLLALAALAGWIAAPGATSSSSSGRGRGR